MTLPQEKLGAFYLGNEYDLKRSSRIDIPVNYDARDLTTHAVCVGMTGSGKTGLCIGLLEEAALDKVPTIMIDPKGDITNLLLQFPDLQADDFKPWINADDARRKDMSIEEYAAATAEKWKAGLADCGIGAERLRSLKDSADYTIFTPGSDAGVPVSILGSLTAPKLDFQSNSEVIRERIGGTISALLGLAGVKADPVRSREAVLLAGIFEHFWSQGQDMDLARLILSIQEPPMRQVGVFDVDTFFPPKDRFELSMAFNTLMASPGFQSWLQGDPLDIDSLLFTADGKPRHSIFYLAHLPESERMFFVTLLLENMLTWIRTQPGTTSLRALLYFDEVFGFLPPVSEPPSKRPLMTMLKQARAFGLGCILVTQNPVDIDYKGLTNAGTWFIGKLQAERDKARVLEGLKNAISEAGGNSESIDYDALISQLGSRVFLLHNVHEDRPVVFQTRWAMSYLRGPLTRPQVRLLMEKKKSSLTVTEDPGKPSSMQIEPPPENMPDADQEKLPEGYLSQNPSLDPSIRQHFLPLQISRKEALLLLEEELGALPKSATVRLFYRPGLLGFADVYFIDKRRGIKDKAEKKLLLHIPDATIEPDWKNAVELPFPEKTLLQKPETPENIHGPYFAPVQKTVNNNRKLAALSRQLDDWLYYHERKTIAVHEELNLFQHPDESPREFSIRLQQAAREKRDDAIDALEKKFEKQIARLEKKLRKEKRELAKDEREHDNRKKQELVSIGETLIGFFMGRRSSSRINTTLNKRRMTARAKAEIEESHEEIEELHEEIENIETEMQEQVEEISKRWMSAENQLKTDALAPRRTDINIHSVNIGWLPFWTISWDDGTISRKKTYEAFSDSQSRFPRKT
ncbi:MAG: ATP-binding protein [Chlorobium phaeobacteroides]|uniref:Helicase HerA central domain-containing protein n=1 Tax=Chlorobium phaeobacteroides (strain BS1) TaxID=331678 RepID=B3EJ76_CHLPB|nr:ATP-binding protein [Chlorobium phaeobacteroides]